MGISIVLTISDFSRFFYKNPILPIFLLLLQPVIVYFMQIRNALAFIFITLLLSCSQKKVSPLVKDSIHAKEWISTFQNADIAKYDQNFPKAKALFESFITENLSEENKIYAHNQLIFCQLNMNQDSLAGIAMQQLEAFQSDTSQWTVANKADFYFNKGVLNYRNEAVTPSIFLEKALFFYQKIYPNQHLKVAQTNLQLALWHFEYGSFVNIARDYLNTANLIFTENQDLAPYRAENHFAQALSFKSERASDKMIEHSTLAKNLIRSNTSFQNNVLFGRCLILESFAHKQKAILPDADSTQRKREFSLSQILLEKALTLPTFRVHQRVQELYQNIAWLQINQIQWSKNPSQDSVVFFKTINQIHAILQQQKRQFVHPNYLIGAFLQYKNTADNHQELPLKAAIQELDTFAWDRRRTLDFCFSFLDLHYNDIKDFQNALFYNKKTILANLPKKDTALHIYSDKVKFCTPYQAIAYRKRGNIFLNSYKNSKEEKALKEAIYCYDLADSLLFSNILNYDEDIVLSFQNEVGKALYQSAIEANYQLFQAKKDKNALNRAFKYMDRMKSYLLSKDLQKERNNAEMAIIKRIKALKYEESKIISSKQITPRLEQIANEIKGNYAFIKRDFPALYKDFVVQEIPTVQQIQASLPTKNEAILEYKWTNTDLYAIFISSDSIIFHHQKWNKDDFAALEAYQNHLSKKENAIQSAANVRFATHSQRLYQLLLGRFHQHWDKVKLLTVIPDKQLNNLPFEALLATKISENLCSNYGTMPFLVQKIAIAYSPSWKVWNNNRTAVLPAQPNVAFYTYGNDARYVLSLKSNEKEKSAIQAFATDNHFFTFEKNNCTTANFTGQINQFDIVHLSLHARCNFQKRDSNIIYFNLEKNKLSGELMGYEVMNLNAKKGLLILSACETAQGNNQFSEGTFSLSRSFFQAGFSNIIASFWRIDDDATGDLLTYFYQHLSKKNATFALQEAKIAFLKQHPKKNNPYYWSGLVGLK
jgi:CHAT domain-containing protein